MQANKFVKEHGWDKAKELLTKANGCASIKSMGHHFLYSDLERLVESWELVEGLGGVEYAKYSLERMALQVIDGGCDDQYKTLKQAIADVESCQ